MLATYCLLGTCHEHARDVICSHAILGAHEHVCSLNARTGRLCGREFIGSAERSYARSTRLISLPSDHRVHPSMGHRARHPQSPPNLRFSHHPIPSYPSPAHPSPHPTHPILFDPTQLANPILANPIPSNPIQPNPTQSPFIQVHQHTQRPTPRRPIPCQPIPRHPMPRHPTPHQSTPRHPIPSHPIPHYPTPRHITPLDDPRSTLLCPHSCRLLVPFGSSITSASSPSAMATTPTDALPVTRPTRAFARHQMRRPPPPPPPHDENLKTACDHMWTPRSFGRQWETKVFARW